MFMPGLFHFTLLLAVLDTALSVSLNITAIGVQDGKSRFECWQLSTPFEYSDQSGLVGSGTTFLGDVANITYNVIPASFDSGVHTAPTAQ